MTDETKDIYLHDMPASDVELMDQAIMRRAEFETGIIPRPQTVAKLRNQDIQGYIHRRAEQERMETAAFDVELEEGLEIHSPVDMLITRMPEEGVVRVVVRRDEASRLKWVLDQDNLEYTILY